MSKKNKKSDEDETASGERRRGLSPLARRLLWLIAYYAVMAAVAALLWRRFPEAERLFGFERLGVTPQDVDFPPSGAGAATGAPSTRFTLSALSLLSMICAVWVALPVAWVYLLTRRKKGFFQEMPHTLIILPIATAGVVVLIQDSLALAFSLAGIAAAVRFRNTLDDTKDAVYIFVAIGIGISAALGALVVAMAMTLIFNVTILVMWWTDFGKKPTKLEDKRPVKREEEEEEEEEEESDEREMARGEGVRDGDGRRESLLRVHAIEADPAQKRIEEILEEEAARWELVGVMPAENGLSRLDYHVRLKKNMDRGSLLSALRKGGSPHLVGVEFR